jgi:hypothetical protein
MPDCWSIVRGTMLSYITLGFLVILIFWLQRRLAIKSKFEAPLGILISSWISMIIKGGLSTSMSLEKLFCKSQKSCNLWLESKTLVIVRNSSCFLFVDMYVVFLLLLTCYCIFLLVTTIICLLVVIAIVCLLLHLLVVVLIYYYRCTILVGI